MKRHGEMSPMDEGYCLSWEQAAKEALWLCRAHMDRLEPGRSKKTREALENLEASIASVLLVRFGYQDPRGHDL